MRSPECDPEKVLRRALGHAGLVEGYDHSCRRCKSRGTPHVERHADPALRRCPACSATAKQMWMPWRNTHQIASNFRAPMRINLHLPAQPADDGVARGCLAMTGA